MDRLVMPSASSSLAPASRARRAPRRRSGRLRLLALLAAAFASVALIEAQDAATAGTATLSTATGEIVSLGFANGRLLSAGLPGTGDPVQIWDAPRGTVLQTLPIAGVVSAAISPDGHTVGAVSIKTVQNNKSTYEVSVWDVNTGIRTAVLATETVTNLRYTNIVFADGGRLVAANHGGQVRLWNVTTGALVRTLLTSASTARLIAVSPDGGQLAVGSLGDDAITMWRIADGVKTATIAADLKLSSLAISPLAAVGAGGWATPPKYGAADVFSMTGAAAAPIFPHPLPVSVLTFSGDGQRLITASVDGYLRHWNVADGSLAGTNSMESSASAGGLVTALAASADGRLAHSAGPGAVILRADPYADADGDFLRGDEDNCPWTANADQADGDANGRGDACDLPATLEAYFSVQGAFASQSVRFDAAGSSGPQPIVAYDWDLDGNGSFERTGAPVTISNTFATPGIYQVGVRVTDTLGAQATFRRPVAITDAVQRVPVAANATLDVDEDVAATGDLLAIDVASRPLTYVLVTMPARGAISLDAATGAFEYRPNPNVSGADAFTFRATNGSASSNVATVTIAIAPVNDAPAVLTPIADVEMSIGAPATTIDVSGTFADLDLAGGEQLAISAQSGDTSITNVVVSDKRLTLYCGYGTGTATVTVRAADPAGAVAETSFRVNVTPRTPSLIYPTAHATGVATTRNFEWTRVGGASSYLLLIGSTPGGWDLLAVRVTEPSYRVTQVLPSSRPIYARVAATIGGIDHYADPVPFTAAAMAPTLTYPAANASNVTLSRNFEWTAVAGADSYLLLLGTTPGGWDLLAVRTAQPSYRVGITLPAGRTLYARAAARIGGIDHYGDPVAFTPASSIPVMTYPAAGATALRQTGGRFEWTAVLGAESYLLLIGTTPGGWDVLAVAVAQPSYRVLNPLPTGRTLYARVAARLNGVDHYGEPVAFEALDLTPALLSPAPGGEPDPARGFEWTAVPGADSYLLLIGTRPFGWDVLAIRVTDPSYLATLPAGTFYVTLASELGGVAYYGDTTPFVVR